MAGIPTKIGIMEVITQMGIDLRIKSGPNKKARQYGIEIESEILASPIKNVKSIEMPMTDSPHKICNTASILK
jgi:hypothetical protein